MELIRIDNDGKITARELYEFLELAPTQFSRWAKSNIEQDEFYTQGVDWQGFDIMSSGNNIKDYSLTIDFAKHLCMLSRSDKGKQARSYFIEVEKRSLKPLCMEDMMIAQLQSMKEVRLQLEQTTAGLAIHDSRLSQLEEIQSHKAEIVKELPAVNQMDQRSQLNQIVRGYSDRNNIPHSNSWHKLYEQFLYRYSINIKVRAGNRKQKPLDYCQHNGYLSDLLSLAIDLFC